jgi:hypothetical protein
MTRQEMDERLVDFLYDELEGDERARFEASLAAHPEVQAELAAHTATRSMLASSGALDELRMPPGLLDGVMREARVVAAPPEEPTASWLDKLLGLLLQPAMAVALVGVLMAGTGIYLARQGSGEPKMADSVALQAPANSPTGPEGAAPPELAEAPAKAVADPETPAAAAEVWEAAAAESPAADAPEAGGGDGAGVRAVAEGALARLQPIGDEADGNAAEAPPIRQEESVASRDRKAAAKPRASEPRRLAVPGSPEFDSKSKSGKGSAKSYQPFPEVAYGAEREQAADAKPTTSAPPAKAPPAQAAPAKKALETAPAETAATKDARLNQVQTAEEKRAADPMDAVRKEAAGQDKDAERGKYLLAQVDKFAAAGREDLVDQTIALLEKVPGWEGVARGRRSAAVARRAKGAGGGPALVPADREYDYEDSRAQPAAEPSSAPSKKGQEK